MNKEKKLDILATYVKAEIIKRGFEDVLVDSKIFAKNNEQKKYALSFKYATSNIGTVVYVDDIIDIDTENAASMVVNNWEEISRALKEGESVEYNNFLTPDFIRKNIRLQMINAEWNKEFLQGVPHGHWNDLAYVFRILVDIPNSDKSGSFIVNNDMLKKISFSMDELLSCAMNNIHIRADYLAGSMMVYTDEQWGAAALMCPDVFKRQAENYNDLYIIPSSIFEVIAVPVDTVDDVSYLLETISDINNDEQCVKREEVLSNSLYRYDRGENKIEKVR